MTGRPIASVAIAAGLLMGGPALAQDVWTGPYLGPTYGRGTGTATYVFNTDGYYNTAAGQTYVQPLTGSPLGGVIGYNWQNGQRVYGIETFFFSHGISAQNSCLVAWPQPPPGSCGTPSPFVAGQEFDMKGHWFTGFTGRIGLARGGILVYLQGGFAFGHLVTQLNDPGANLQHWAYGTVAGLTAGAGVEIAVGPRWSVGLGYRGLWMRPMHVTGVSRDPVTLDPAGPGTATDHTLQYMVHEVLGRIVFHPGRRGEVDVGSRPPFDWPGVSFGLYAGALWQLGLQVGYDWAIGERFIAGINGQASLNIYRGRSLEGDLNVRLGFALRDVLLYGEAGIGTQTGDFFDILFGPFVTAGFGVEVAFTDRVTGFLEMKAVHAVNGDVADGNFQAGLNFHLGQH